MSQITERFLKYVKFDTQSNERTADKCPSTEKQKFLADCLYQELQEMGITDIRYDKKRCYLYATIPGNMKTEKKLGFLAHMDTSPAVSGADVSPRIVENYDGKDILLNQKDNIWIRTTDFPEILDYVGKDLIVTDGCTLLGADDKAGVAEIMTMAAMLMENKEIQHGDIQIAFTPDEEIGQGTDFFELDLFQADYAYTVDGGGIGELEYENFNAAGAKVKFCGRSVHPGEAKHKMINAILLGQEFQSLLPVFENPMYTERYEGFYHLDEFAGNVEEANAEYIIRDHDRTKFEEKKRKFLDAAKFMNQKYGEGTVLVELKDSYYNMKEIIDKHFHLVENAACVMRELQIEPKIVPIRGGTDGARLSFMGLPCPNICTGGHNFHGKYEYICIQSMEKVVEILLGLCQKYK